MEVIKFLPVLRKRYHSWDQLEAQINALPTTKQKGDAFEQFMYCFIKIFSVRFDTKDVYLTKDAPENLLSKYDITRSDAGVDGILVTNSGKVIALQAKFRQSFGMKLGIVIKCTRLPMHTILPTKKKNIQIHVIY